MTERIISIDISYLVREALARGADPSADAEPPEDVEPA